VKGGIIAAGWGERLGRKIPKALTPVAGRPLIDFALEGFKAAGIREITCIVNESARAVPDYVRARHPDLAMDWIIQTTPSSMHSFWIVLERLSQSAPGPFLMTTVDSVCPPDTYRLFAESARLFPEADVVLGLTNFIDDEKPLRVAMRGEEDTGILPPRIADNPEAFEIVAMTSHGFDSEFVTSGFYGVRPSILEAKAAARAQGFSALRQYLGHLLKFGARFYGVPLPPVIDVDRPQDVAAAQKLLGRV